MDSADLLLLRRDDLLGPKELDVSNSKPLKQLNGLRGLHAVKQSVDTLLGLIRTNAELEEMERPLKDVCLNRVFVGNPGTGKHTHVTWQLHYAAGYVMQCHWITQWSFAPCEACKYPCTGPNIVRGFSTAHSVVSNNEL